MQEPAGEQLWESERAEIMGHTINSFCLHLACIGVGLSCAGVLIFFAVGQTKNVYKPLAYLIVFRVSNEYILSFIYNTISPSSKIDTKISSVCSYQQSSTSFRHLRHRRG